MNRLTPWISTELHQFCHSLTKGVYLFKFILIYITINKVLLTNSKLETGCQCFSLALHALLQYTLGNYTLQNMEYGKLLETHFHGVLAIKNKLMFMKNSDSKESRDVKKKNKFTARYLLGVVKIKLVPLKGSSENLKSGSAHVLL